MVVNKKAMKRLEDMNVIDDFLFTEIMADQEYGLEVCRMILSCVLKRKIGNIRFTAQKTVPGISEKSHGIRLDAYVTEDTERTEKAGNDIRVYDVEPDRQSSKKESLFFRMIRLVRMQCTTKRELLSRLIRICCMTMVFEEYICM